MITNKDVENISRADLEDIFVQLVNRIKIDADSNLFASQTQMPIETYYQDTAHRILMTKYNYAKNLISLKTFGNYIPIHPKNDY